MDVNERNISLLNFTWKATHFDGKILKIKVNFTNKVEVSPY